MTMVMNMKQYEDIRQYLEQLEIIDTHEHLPPFENLYGEKDFFRDYFFHYFPVCIDSIGLSKETKAQMQNIEISVADRWMILAPYWDMIKNCSYSRYIEKTIFALYDIDKLNADTIEQAADNYMSFKGSRYNYILKEKCNIKTALNDYWQDQNFLEYDSTYFNLVYRIDRFVAPSNFFINALSKKYSSTVNCLDDYLILINKDIDCAIRSGAIAFKAAMAYMRVIKFPDFSYEMAKQDFANHLKNYISDQIANESIQNYLMHYVLSYLNGLGGQIVQFHTGILMQWGKLSNTNPINLENLILKYRNVTFDLFHIGYPYWNEAGAMAHMYPNTVLDMCWANIISQNGSCVALREWLDLIPVSKICAFGGDFMYPDTILGHLIMAKDNVAKVLSNMVDDDVIDIEYAKIMGKMLFYDNPKRIFNL